MRKIKLTMAIQVPETMSPSLFNEDFIKCAIKLKPQGEKKDRVYYIVRTDKQECGMVANPGDWICKKLNGDMCVMSDEHYKKYYQNDKGHE